MFQDGFISKAYAESHSIKRTDQLIVDGLLSKQRQALILLEKFNSAKLAKNKIGTYQNNMPNAAIIKRGSDYYISDGLIARPFWDAIKEASRMKNKFNYNPSIMTVPPLAPK